MKIVIVNTADKGGGAENIASALANGLRTKGHQVSFLCSRSYREDSCCITNNFDWVLGRTLKHIGYADSISMAAYRFLSRTEVREADVIHFHNLHGFYFGVAMLPRIVAVKPCLWTLHDCWPISGGCYWHLDQTNQPCRKWQVNCKPCPSHRIFPMTGLLDTASYMLSLKRRAFSAMARHACIVSGVSDWMSNRIKEAFIVSNINPAIIQTVSNYIDIPKEKQSWLPLPSSIPLHNPLILLVAADVNNHNKGMAIALNALQNNLEKPFTLVTVGTPFSESTLSQFGLLERTVQLGRIENRFMLASVYRASKFTVVPSLAESFCLVAGESIACGTPVVASNIAALPDLIHNGQTGYLAISGDILSFSRKIRSMLDMPESTYSSLRESTLKFSENNFHSFQTWVEVYLTLYHRAISEHRT